MGYSEKLMVDLRMLGIREGNAVLVHSSLKGLNALRLTPADVVEGLQRLLTPAGTLLVPAFSYDQVTPRSPVFHCENTPCCVGALPEWFRTQAARFRSIHPTHSVCAWGRMAYAITAWHSLDSTPVGPHSPLMQLPKLGGKILMLGCGLRPNTFLHGVEELAHVPYGMAKRPVEYRITDAYGKTYRKQYLPHDFTGLEQRYERLEELLPSGACAVGSVLGGKAFLLDAAAVEAAALHKLQKDPWFFVDRA